MTQRDTRALVDATKTPSSYGAAVGQHPAYAMAALGSAQGVPFQQYNGATPSYGQAVGQHPAYAMAAFGPGKGAPLQQYGGAGAAPVYLDQPKPALDGQNNININIDHAQAPPPGQAAPIVIVQEAGCCTCGIGWALFILGWFFLIPWFVGGCMLCCKQPPRERPGLIACAIASGISILFIIIGAAIVH